MSPLPRLISHSWPALYNLVQRAHYKSSNVKKLEAAVKLYGVLYPVYPDAIIKLTSMLLHPFPRIRNLVADTLYGVSGAGKGVDWTKAQKEDLVKLRRDMGWTVVS